MEESEARRLCGEAAAICTRGGSMDDVVRAAEMFKAVADAGYPDGMFGLAELKYAGLGTEADISGAIALYRSAGEKGNIPAWFRLGNILVENEEYRDFPQAVACFNRCAEARFPPAFACLGDLYYYGMGVEANQETAANWYRLSATSGDARSMYKLGLMYRTGAGVEKDDNASEAFLTMSAENGLPEGQFEIASQIYDGKMEGGKKEAARWYAACADAIPTAKFNLATMYIEGDGVEKDAVKAFRLYKDLADQVSDADALFQVGRMLLEGLGTESNPEEGFQYLGKAANAGHQDAAVLFDMLRRKMNTQIITIDGTEGQ